MQRIWRGPSASSTRARRACGNSWTPERLVWTLAAWEDYLHWQSQDRKTLRRINSLIQDMLRHPFEDIGIPEAQRENLAGCWSRRSDDTHRIVYAMGKDEVTVIACRYHYEK